MRILSTEECTYDRAAMESSSYMRLNKAMLWFTGNIGFHHIHLLNVRIPFYCLPDVMDTTPELRFLIRNGTCIYSLQIWRERTVQRCPDTHRHMKRRRSGLGISFRWLRQPSNGKQRITLKGD
jgi:fatty acid desaturase